MPSVNQSQSIHAVQATQKQPGSVVDAPFYDKEAALRWGNRVKAQSTEKHLVLCCAVLTHRVKNSGAKAFSEISVEVRLEGLGQVEES